MPIKSGRRTNHSNIKSSHFFAKPFSNSKKIINLTLALFKGSLTRRKAKPEGSDADKRYSAEVQLIRLIFTQTLARQIKRGLNACNAVKRVV